MKKLKKLISIFLFIGMTFFITNCDDNDDLYYDNTPPSPPRNVITVTGDNRVDITWDYNNERDIAGYNVYYNFNYEGRYTLLGNTEDNYFIDFGAENGTIYYYAVSAYDFNGNESELSYDVVYDVPRPEGFNQAVFDYLKFPKTSGYNFSDYLIVSFNDVNSDFFFENYEGIFYINVWEDTDIQDVGETNDIYDISFAPNSGWVPLIQGENVKYEKAIVGHTYIIWTWNNHFAKIRINQITDQRMVFDWAYQLVEGEVQLKAGVNSDKRSEFKYVKNNRTAIK
ncbi:fibronectin type III domain-containing protein [Bacteroidota bacterium]